MVTSKRVLSLLALTFGLLGLVGCLVALVGVWNLGSQVRQATDTVFEKLDGTVVIVHDRAVQTRNRLEASKITTEEVVTTLKDWTKHEAGQRVALQLGIEEKTERLASALQQADHWLEVSESSVGLVQQTLSVVSLAGAPVDPTAVDGLIEGLSSLRAQSAEATEFVTSIRDRTVKKSGERPLKGRIEQAAQLAVRVAATLGTMDSRLDKFTNRLSQTQEDLRELKAKTLRRIWLATFAVMLLILWMAAGQAALAFYGWQSLRQNTH